MPIWSAAVDPYVLRIRASEPTDADICLTTEPDRFLAGADREHLLINHGGRPVRLDIVEGTTTAGPVSLRVDLAIDDRLGQQIAAIRALAEPNRTARSYHRLAERLLALHALDAHAAGASLRESAQILLGPGEWPGDGEHRKSRIRRLIAVGKAMMKSGPRSILAGPF